MNLKINKQMTKEEILLNREAKDDGGVYSDEEIYKAMDEYAKQKSVEFFKWYALRMASFIDYFIKRTDPAFRNEEIEQSVKEHEGATIEQLYQQFTDNQFIEQQNKP